MTIQETQQEIIEEFSLFEDWMQRYEYMIELGKSLPIIPEEFKTCLLYTSDAADEG